MRQRPEERCSYLASKLTVAAVERLTQFDRRHAAVAEQWDSDPWLLNTPEGTVDLRTGKMHGHRREQYISKSTAAGPAGECDLWCRFLDRITNSDADLQSFLQRMIGYCLTGINSEHALFFMYGTGANGKSVFLTSIAGLLGDYAKTAPVSILTASNSEQHPTDLAGLRGFRFVTAIETEDGRWWAEAKIKSLTGGDRITARFMRQDFFEYVPQFKLVIAGNHKPGLRNVDEAMRRRLHLIPFTVTIGDEERDPKLGEKLRSEYPGILKWAIEGCQAWQNHGLNPPPAVRSATTNYLAAEDVLGRWIDDRCLQGREYWTSGAVLFADFQQWCDQVGERTWSQKRFTQGLQGRGIDPVRSGPVGTRGFAGIALCADN
jgi:putative DNA primase/helicase